MQGLAGINRTFVIFKDIFNKHGPTVIFGTLVCDAIKLGTDKIYFCDNTTEIDAIKRSVIDRNGFQ